MKKFFKLTLRRKSAISGYLFILPWILGFILFFIQPIIQTVKYSVNSTSVGSGGLKYDYQGAKYYNNILFEDTNFRKLLVTSLTNMLFNVPVIVIFAFFIAVVLKEKFRGNGAVKTIFFLPVIMASSVYITMNDAYGGALSENVNKAIEQGAGTLQLLKAVDIKSWLYSIGLDATLIKAITDPISKIFSTISLSGIQIFVFLAGMNSIVPSMYEASVIEGATGWETFWKITFPMISPLILVNVVYSMIESFTAMSNPVIAKIYDQTIKLQYGISSAMSMVYFVLVAVVVLLVGFLISRLVFYYN